MARAGNCRRRAKDPALARPHPPASKHHVFFQGKQTNACQSSAGAPIQRPANSTPLSRPCALKAAWVKQSVCALATRTTECAGSTVSCEGHARCKRSQRKRSLHVTGRASHKLPQAPPLVLHEPQTRLPLIGASELQRNSQNESDAERCRMPHLPRATCRRGRARGGRVRRSDLQWCPNELTQPFSFRAPKADCRTLQAVCPHCPTHRAASCCWRAAVMLRSCTRALRQSVCRPQRCVAGAGKPAQCSRARAFSQEHQPGDVRLVSTSSDERRVPESCCAPQRPAANEWTFSSASEELFSRVRQGESQFGCVRAACRQ